MNKAQALQATKNGAIAAFVSAAMTVLVVGIAIGTNADGQLAMFNDPLILIDVVILIGCAIGMLRKSRLASILIFIYFIVAKIIIAIETQAVNGLLLSVVFLYFFGRAIQGSFVYHRISKLEDPSYKATTWLTYVFSIPVVLVLTVLIVFALMSVTGLSPSTRVLAGDELRDRETALLLQEEIVYPEDRIEYFYSHGLGTVLASGNILTSDRVILYLTNEQQEIEVYEIPIDQIVAVDLRQKGSPFQDSEYMVRTNDQDVWLKLFLSIEQKGDEKFVKALRNKLVPQLQTP